MDITVEGEGYGPAEYSKNNEIGTILVDGIFSPVTQVLRILYLSKLSR